MNSNVNKAVLAEESGSKKIIILQALGILLMGIYSMFCTHFHQFFAKIHITIPGTELPLFLGEVLLVCCLILLVILWKMTSVKFNKWYLLLLFAIMFVLIKAIYGYHKWGGLAFRNAALFYYSLFALAGYNFYNRKIFNKKVIIILLGILLLNKFTGGFYDYFISTYLFLSIVLILKIKKEWLNKIQNKWLKFIYLTILLGIIFLTLPYGYFFSATRTITVGNCVATLFIAAVFFLKCSKIRKIFELPLFVLCILILGVIIFRQKGGYAVRSMFMPNELVEAYKEMDKEHRQRLPGYKFKVFKTKLYSEEYILPHTTVATEVDSSNVVYPENASTVVPTKLDETEKKIALAYKSTQMATTLDSSMAYEQLEKAQGQIKTVQQKYEARKSAQTQFDGEFNNILWRLFAWRDMVKEVITSKAVFGIDFGKPFRSETIETIRWADGEWVGWLEPHNSYVHVLYRAGIAGIVLIGFLVFGIACMIQRVIHVKLYLGIFLIAIILYWFTAVSFGVILELPYYAIPFWSLFGLIYGYCKTK